MSFREYFLSEVTANLVIKAGGNHLLKKQKGFVEGDPEWLTRVLKRIRIDSERAESPIKDRKDSPRGLYK